MKSNGPCLRLYGTSRYLRYDHVNWRFKEALLLYISIIKNRKCLWRKETLLCLIAVDHQKWRQTVKRLLQSCDEFLRFSFMAKHPY